MEVWWRQHYNILSVLLGLKLSELFTVGKQRLQLQKSLAFLNVSWEVAVTFDVLLENVELNEALLAVKANVVWHFLVQLKRKTVIFIHFEEKPQQTFTKQTSRIKSWKSTI